MTPGVPSNDDAPAVGGSTADPLDPDPAAESADRAFGPAASDETASGVGKSVKTESGAELAPIEQRRRSLAPQPMVATYLWSAVILGQSALLAVIIIQFLVAVTTAAFDLYGPVITDPFRVPFLFFPLVMIVLEISLVIRVHRGGSRSARVWLLVLAVAWLLALTWVLGTSSWLPTAVLVALSVLSIAAAVLTFSGDASKDDAANRARVDPPPTTELSQEEASAGIEAIEEPLRSPPRPVVAASYLWWATITTQIIVAVVLALQQLIPLASWDASAQMIAFMLLVGSPYLLGPFIPIAFEIPQVIRLRRGRGAARIWLLVLTIMWVAAVTLVFGMMISALPPAVCLSILGLAIPAAVLTCNPSANEYFRQARQRRRPQRAAWSADGYRPADLDVEGEPAPETSGAEPARRRRRTKVAAAIGGGLLLVAVLIAMAVPGGPLNPRYNREAPVDLSAFEEVDWDRYVDLTVYDDEYEGEHFIAYGTIQGASGSCPSVAFVNNVQNIDADDYREWKCLLPAAGDVSDPDPPNLSAFETGTHVKMWVTVVTEKMRGDERFPVDLNSFAVHHLEEIPDR